MCWPGWRIGIRGRLKSVCPYGRAGSSPAPGTIAPGAMRMAEVRISGGPHCPSLRGDVLDDWCILVPVGALPAEQLGTVACAYDPPIRFLNEGQDRSNSAAVNESDLCLCVLIASRGSVHAGRAEVQLYVGIMP